MRKQQPAYYPFLVYPEKTGAKTDRVPVLPGLDNMDNIFGWYYAKVIIDNKESATDILVSMEIRLDLQEH